MLLVSKEKVAGLIATLATGTGVTDTGTAPTAPSDVAVTVAVPTATPVTTPDGLTVAIDGFRLAQTTVRSGIGAPPASRGVATSVCVVPCSSDSVAGRIVTEATGMRTVTLALPTRPSAVADTVVVPSPKPVTTPVALTVAIAGLAELHVTGRPVSATPAASRTIAESSAVTPGASGPTALGETSTVAAVTGGVLPPPPQAERTASKQHRARGIHDHVVVRVIIRVMA